MEQNNVILNGTFRAGKVFAAPGQIDPPFVSGKYTPGHMKADGVFVSACWRGTMFVSDGTDSKKRIRLTVWNGRNSNEGYGSADQFAKKIPTGTLIRLSAHMEEPYATPCLDSATNAQIVDSAGKIVTHYIDGYKYIPRSLGLIDDGDLALKFRIHAKNMALNKGGVQVNDFETMFNIDDLNPQYAELMALKSQVRKARNALVFTAGLTRFGFAQVMAIPAGATQMNKPPVGYVHQYTNKTGTGTITDTGVAQANTATTINTAGVAKFDPNTGLPLAAAAAKFDPHTGQPLTAINDPVARFDPNTGQPLATGQQQAAGGSTPHPADAILV